MKPDDILDMIGDAKGAYVWDAQQVRSGAVLNTKRKLPAKKMWLIAAVIALTAVLVGCAVVYALSLRDMAFGKEDRTYYDGFSEERTLLSIQGIKGTPGYLATKEWYEWLQTYDTDLSVYHSEEAFSEDFGDDYYEYNLYSQEMKDKLDEICEKYGLELLGKMYVDPDVEAACKALQIPGIFRPGANVEVDCSGISYYANGSFRWEGTVTLPGSNEQIVIYRCNRKNAFSDLYSDIGPEGTYEEWSYTTSYGVDVLMVLDYGGICGNASMFVERGEYVYEFNISELDTPLPDKAEMEAYAEAFDFTVQPQRVSQQDIQKTEERREADDAARAEAYDKRARSYSELGYEDRIKFNLECALNPGQLGFAVMDLEGNGSEELLVGENGYIRAVYTTKDGGTQHMMPLSIIYPNVYNTGADKGVGELQGASWSYLYLCENNSLAYVYALAGGGAAYHFASPVNGEMVWTDRILYNPLNPNPEDSKWQRFDENHQSHPITEEKFNRIIASYPRVVLEMYPISDYPLTDDSPSGIGRAPDVYDSYDALVQNRTEWETDRSGWRYQLTDLDGDGQKELIWKEGSWTGVFTMKDGQVKQLVSGPDVTLCEGNILAVVRSYLDGNKTYSYFKIVGGNAVLVDYLRYDADKNPDNPWMRSTDNSGQDISMAYISQTEFDEIRGKYTPAELDMKPFTEYPLT